MDTINSRLIIIAPTVPPNVCGVSDYAFKTFELFKQSYDFVELGIESFLKLETDEKHFKNVSLWKSAILHARATKESSDVLLNFAPLAYSKTGMPVRLLLLLRKFKKRSPGNRLFIFFHETWSGDNKLKIHHRVRDYLIKCSISYLIGLSNGIAAVTEKQKQKLKPFANRQKLSVHLIPIGSNILPAAKTCVLNSSRITGRWVIFGLPHTRLWTLKMHLPIIKYSYQQGILKELYAIGPKENAYADEEAALAIEHLGEGALIQTGELTPEDVSKEFLLAEAGLLGQDEDGIQKSGTFAAMAAHGLSVVCNLPIELKEPPGDAFFNTSEIYADHGSRLFAEHVSRNHRLYNWFTSSRSWEAIVKNLSQWMNSANVNIN